MKRYHFLDYSWTDTPACDCCDYEELMECYNIDYSLHPEVIQNGSAHSIEDCYEQVLEWEGILKEDWREDDMNWKEEALYLEDLMWSNGLQIAVDGLGNVNVYP